MAQDFVGMNIAVMVVTASIVLAGILIGLGRAFRNKGLEQFGVNELFQSIVNAAIIGSFGAIIALIAQISTPEAGSICGTGGVIDQLACMLQGINVQLFVLFGQITQTLNLIGYYQTLILNLGSLSISPFGNLSSVSQVLSIQLLTLNLVMMLLSVNVQIANFISGDALLLIFPLGLVLRTFFATRKIGGFLIALSIGLVIFYPSFIMIFASPSSAIGNSTQIIQNFNNNTYYATEPVIDLNNNHALAAKLDIMSGRCSTMNLSNTTSNCAQFNQSITNTTTNFTGDLTGVIQANTDAISGSLIYAAIAPLFSLLLTAIFVKELGGLLGGEIGAKTFSQI